MFNQHRRLPPLCVLTLATLLGALYLRTWGRPGAAPGQGQSLEQLSAAIATTGKNDPQTWYAYGQRLLESKKETRFQEAAVAFRRVLELAPAPELARNARLACATTLARAAMPPAAPEDLRRRQDELAIFLRELIFSEPKLVVDLFERAELRPYLAQERFARLQNEARSQAMD